MHLTRSERQRLVRAIQDDLGPQLAYGEFIEACFDLLEDIPGLEGIDYSTGLDLINKLWRTYSE